MWLAGLNIASRSSTLNTAVISACTMSIRCSPVSTAVKEAVPGSRGLRHGDAVCGQFDHHLLGHDQTALILDVLQATCGIHPHAAQDLGRLGQHVLAQSRGVRELKRSALELARSRSWQRMAFSWLGAMNERTMGRARLHSHS